jgi:hypothetical protein
MNAENAVACSKYFHMQATSVLLLLPLLQVLRLWQGQAACCAWPSTTPGKVAVGERARLGQLQHQLKQYSRGEVQQLEWLDTLLLRVGVLPGWQLAGWLALRVGPTWGLLCCGWLAGWLAGWLIV